MTYSQAEQYLLEIPKFTKKNPVENTKKFMEYLGNKIPYKNSKIRPQMSELNHVIHVAGTNGKGSVCSYLNQILIEAGYKVGMFTSPHLITMTERFQINGKPVSEEQFVWAFSVAKEKVLEGVKEGVFSHPTFFEFLVGMAYLIFTEEHVDYLILETGLGGKLDATNIVNKPLACVITSIGYDHTEFLGETLQEIAGEKAGIIKEGVPVIYDGSNSEVSVIIEQKAKEMDAKTYEVTMKNCKIVDFGKKTIDFLLEYEYYNSMRISLGTSAFYQMMNAALAVVTIEKINLNPKIPSDAIVTALRDTVWPGRMEWLRDDFLIDGAHNENGMKLAVQTIKELKKEVVLLYTAVKDKNYRDIIRLLCESVELQAVVVTELDTPRAVVAEELQDVFQQFYDGPVYCEKKMEQAVQRAEDLCEKGIIFGTGSLYLIGELRKLVLKI